MIGPTGVGKSEIARRVARIVNAPFIKVEATKFTEVGYVGRDVESIVRDLVEAGISLQHAERMEAVRDQASGAAAQRLIDLLVEQRDRKQDAAETDDDRVVAPEETALTPAEKRRKTRRQKEVAELLHREQLEDETVEIDMDVEFDSYSAPIEIVSGVSPEELHDSMREFIDAISPRRQQKRVSVREARRILTQQEANRLVDFGSVVDGAIRRVEETGVVFIDEIDKTIHSGSDYGPDVSGEGVQRDLLPIIEGSVVMTRYGPVKTDHVLFIAAGSFSSSRPSDLIPELQGRFPLRVELDSLEEDDLYQILTVPENALTRQSTAMLATEGVDLRFEESGLREIAGIAADVNARTEDIGARRLLAIVERVLEEISFDAPERSGDVVIVDDTYVIERIGDIGSDEDLSNAIL
jgi:ATP-dependent HslUV protease ATP-binding subunit HslU